MDSFREPTRYQIMEVTIGEVCSSFVKTTSPFFRMVRRTSSVVSVEDVASKDIFVLLENESDQQKLGDLETTARRGNKHCLRTRLNCLETNG